MALYEASWTITTGAAAANAGVFWNANASRIVWVRELGIFCGSAAIATDLQLIRLATRGTQSTTVVGLPQDPADVAATATFDSAWSAAPTVGTGVLRRIYLPATVGAGVIWTWPPSGNSKGLKITGAAGLQIWQISTAAAPLRGYVVWDE